jgi:hypothetical protein
MGESSQIMFLLKILEMLARFKKDFSIALMVDQRVSEGFKS